MKKLLFLFLLIPALVSAQIQTINVGAVANDGTGDKLRVSMQKINANFTYTMAQVALKADASALTSHTGNNSNPHGVTKAQVGLSNADNTSDANKPVSTAQQTAIDGVNATLSSHTANVSNPHSTTKTHVGLGNVDNTSDANKPISSATQTALDAKVSIVNSSSALTDASTIDISSKKHTLASSAATRTFTISYTGDDSVIELTLSATSSTYTFPVGTKCTSEGVSSGNNTMSLAGVSGDKYIIAIKKIGSNYYAVAKNFKQ